MTSQSIPVLLVTANVGSIFEDPSQMLKTWTDEFLSTVTTLKPKFIALHCQEVGGKNYENSMKHVEEFVSLLTSSNELRLFDKVRVFLDEDYSSAENFTALGNFYFVHESVEDVQIYNFKDFAFAPANGKEIYSGNIEAVVTKEKAKFPQELFPECKWSRKGFLRTRWSIQGTIFDLVNIHLFHDASNFVAMESYPSVYCKNRRRALEHTLQRFHSDPYGRVPYFLFGDFNFRTDTDSVVKKLTEGMNATRIQNNKNSENTKLQYTNEESQLVLTVGKKEFNHWEHQSVFSSPSETWLKSFDKELEAFENTLTEFPVVFPPSYPFEEKITQATNYMQTRCPAWCDRVLLSTTAKQLVNTAETTEYNLIGRDTCMGDHKPVYLKMALVTNAGIIRCCDHVQPFLVSCSCCNSSASVFISVIDLGENDYPTNTRKSYTDIYPVDSKLLHEPITRDMLSHDPYTPESADSRSPCVEASEQADIKELRRRSVTPQELKCKLERILRLDTAQSLKRSVSSNIECRLVPMAIFRNRAMSELPGKIANTMSSNLSKSSASSTSRLESHHSSSDESWYAYSDAKLNSRESIDEINDKIAHGSDELALTNDKNIRDEYAKVTKIKDRRCMNTKNCCLVM